VTTGCSESRVATAWWWCPILAAAASVPVLAPPNRYAFLQGDVFSGLFFDAFFLRFRMFVEFSSVLLTLKTVFLMRSFYDLECSWSFPPFYSLSKPYFF
jgi:hypothetical protein